MNDSHRHGCNGRTAAQTPSDPHAAGDPAALRDRIAQAVRDVRATTPLAQSFTNFVTINLVANAQLAAGGTAAMSFLPDDVIDTSAISGADYINVGTLLPFYKEALPQIARAFHQSGHPWVLDPVAAGIGATRTAILTAFKDYPPSRATSIPARGRPAWNPSTTWNPRPMRPGGWPGIWRLCRPAAKQSWRCRARSIW